MSVKRWIASLDGWPEKKVSQVEVVRASDYDALAAMVARLEEALKQAAEDLQLVGDDYPGSSCHKWCSESAATARAALADDGCQS